MARSFESWVGIRYVRARSGDSFVSLISAISMLGIAIAVAVLITVMSVVNGFERELKDRLLAMTAHGMIYDSEGQLLRSQDLVDAALENEDVRAAAPYVTGQALLVHERQMSGAELRGIEPQSEDAVSGISAAMQQGSLGDITAGSFNILLGVELASELGVDIGDKVTVNLSQGRVTPAGLVPRTKRFTVSGIYRIGMFEFDRRLAFINIRDAQRLYRKQDAVTGVRLAVHDVYRAGSVTHDVALTYGERVMISDWTGRHVNLFRSIQITKSILFVIMLLVVAVAAFNIVSTLVMVVKDKQSDIAILKTIGAQPSSILKVFMTQGSIVGVLGTAAGVIGGVLLALNLESVIGFFESMFGIKILAADVYFISDLPSDLQYWDVINIAIIALLLALLSTLYPAWIAAKTSPAEALRYD